MGKFDNKTISIYGLGSIGFNIGQALLKKNEKSHWHRLNKNENLHFYKGDPLIIYISEDGINFKSFRLKSLSKL